MSDEKRLWRLDNSHLLSLHGNSSTFIYYQSIRAIQMTPLETHAKNLAWIDGDFRWIEVDSEHVSATIVNVWYRSLNKVLERHGPDADGNCLDCKNYYFSPTAMPISVKFPCPTYTDITEGLGIPNE